jgi:hypothetical protein
MNYYFVLLLASITLLFFFYVFVDKSALPSFQKELSGILMTKENLFNRKNETLTQNLKLVSEEGWLALEIGYFPAIFLPYSWPLESFSSLSECQAACLKNLQCGWIQLDSRISKCYLRHGCVDKSTKLIRVISSRFLKFRHNSQKRKISKNRHRERVKLILFFLTPDRNPKTVWTSCNCKKTPRFL